MIIVSTLIAIITGLALYWFGKKVNRDSKYTKKYGDEGDMMVLGMGTGLVMGMLMGDMIDNLVLGITLGISIGSAIGAAFNSD